MNFLEQKTCFSRIDPQNSSKTKSISILKWSLFFLWILFLGACAPLKKELDSRRGPAPKSLANTKINFHTSYVTDAEDQMLLKKTAHYHFKENGTYSSFFEGKKFQFGDYSYYKVSENTARIIVTYSKDDGSYTYVFMMRFTTPKKGYWETIYMSAFCSKQIEKGTFIFAN